MTTLTAPTTEKPLILTMPEVSRRLRTHAEWTAAFLDLLRLRRKDNTPTERN